MNILSKFYGKIEKKKKDYSNEEQINPREILQ